MSTQTITQHCCNISSKLLSISQGMVAHGIALLMVRLALAGVFWRSGRSKVVEGTYLEISESTKYLFENDYSAVPLPAELAASLATWSEHAFPILLVLGLATRLSACALLGMTMVIQIFVFPEAWWNVHIIWTALALTLIVNGGGMFSADYWLFKKARH